MNYQLGDLLSSTAITTNSSLIYQTEVWYYPWGGQRWSSGTPPTTFRFTGQRIESGIGLYFYGARWYDSAAGRFIQADTIVPGAGDSQAYDRYAYTNNNPLKYTDPTGHRNCEEDGYNCPGDEIPATPLTVSSTSDPKPLPMPVTTSATNTQNPTQIVESNNTRALESAAPIPTVPATTPIPSTKNNELSGGILWGFNLSGSSPSNYLTGGMDEVKFFNGTRATYNYIGQGQVYGGGASATVYGGIVFNVKKPEDYADQTNSCGITAAIGNTGFTVDYFWPSNNNPFTPGVPQGFTLGWSPGVEAGAWCTTALYQNTWSYSK